MKIMLVHNQYQRPGGEDVVFEQERQLLQRAGHELSIYQRSNVEIDERVIHGRIELVKTHSFGEAYSSGIH